MSRLAIRWTRRALRRLDRVGADISKDSPAAAERVVARIVSNVAALGDHPALGRPGRIIGTRELVFADIPYIVPYRVTPAAVQILTVMHAAQKWPDTL
jgi:addiction module RelE/StbE family toxin